MTQGTHNGSRLNSIQDLDALLASRSLAPVPVKLGGEIYQIRTDLTANEVQAFLDLYGSEQSAAAITILVGTKTERDKLMAAVKASKTGKKVTIPVGRLAAKLDTYLETLPRVHVAIVSTRILKASKALAQYGKTEQEIYAEYDYDVPEDIAEVGGLESDEDDQGKSSAS